MTIYASYRTRCGECQDTIEEGEPIEEMDGEWVHAACADEEDYDFEPYLDDDDLDE